MHILKRNKVYFISILLGILLLITGGVQATTLEKQVVDKDKAWIIGFNNSIDYSNQLLNSISVVDKSGEKVNVRLEVSEDNRFIIVKPPIRLYTEGEEYKLKIERDIYSKAGSRLKESREHSFAINKENPYKNFIKVNVDDILTSENGKQYIFYDVQNLIGADEKSLNENGWNINVYKTIGSDNIRSLIYSDRNSKPLALPFKLKGWMGIYVGYVSDTEEFKIQFKGNEFKFKNYDYIKNRSKSKFINEAFIFAHNFVDSDNINISSVEGKNARIAYIKLVSLSNEQVVLYNSAFGHLPGNMKSVVYDNDGYTDFFMGKYPSKLSLEKSIENMVSKLDARELNWTLGTTGALNYNSVYAGLAFQNSERYAPYIRDGDKLAIQQILNILNQGESPLEIISVKAESLGTKVNASLRMNAFYSDISTQFLNGVMYDQYKDCLQNNSHNLSYYYPKYRNYILNILKEVSISPNLDGITLDFCRYPYVMGNEATEIEKINIMNEFMRQIRKEIPNKKITVRFPYLNPTSYGLDIETWVNEKLVDRIIPSVIGNEEFWDVKKYSKLARDNKVELLIGISANLKGRDLTPETEKLINEGKYVPDNRYVSVEEYLFRANEVYDSGADGIFLFNTLNDLDIREDVSPKYKFLNDKLQVKRWYEFEYKSYLVNNEIKWMF